MKFFTLFNGKAKKYLIAIIFATLSLHYIFADDINNNKINFFINGKSLSNVLNDYSRQNNLQITYSPNISNELHRSVYGRFTVNQKRDLLNVLSNSYGFDWFIAKNRLYITSKQFISKTFLVSSIDMNYLKNTLIENGILTSKFGYSEIPSEDKIVIYGPKEYIDVIANQILQLNLLPSMSNFSIYRLKYAKAADMTINLNNSYGVVNSAATNQQLIIPGVATILSNLINSGNSSNSTKTSPQTMLIGSNNKSDIEKHDTNAISSDNGNINDDFANAQNLSPSIQADPRLNAVIIRDNAKSIRLYKNLIKALDEPTPIIEVAVTIINLDQDKLNEAGVSWWASMQQYGVGYNTSSLGNLSNSGMSVAYGSANPGQLLISNLGSFMSSMMFLEQNGYAKTVSSPALATLDDIPAVAGVSKNIFTGGSSKDSSVSQIQTNTSLAITPHAIFDASGNYIKLEISLLDGDVSSLPSNATMPTNTQSVINSQAVVREGQSLLLASFDKTTNMKVVKKVPFLGDIPLLGWFFSSSSREEQQITTLYIVTPKIIAKDWSSQELSNVIKEGGVKSIKVK